jgi:hypothetical protein
MHVARHRRRRSGLAANVAGALWLTRILLRGLRRL